MIKTNKTTRALPMVKQELHNGCVSACLASLTGLPLSVVTEQFHARYHAHEITVRQYLEELGFYASVGNVEDTNLYGGYIYFLKVPALNAPGMFHCVLMDCRDIADVKVIDPTTGRGVYVQNPVEPGETGLLTWVIECKVSGVPNDWETR